MILKEVLAETKQEVEGAVKQYPEMRSFHEGYAIILEELDELWEEIRKKPAARDMKLLRHEAIQVAAMAARFALDLT